MSYQVGVTRASKQSALRRQNVNINHRASFVFPVCEIQFKALLDGFWVAISGWYLLMFWCDTI